MTNLKTSPRDDEGDDGRNGKEVGKRYVVGLPTEFVRGRKSKSRIEVSVSVVGVPDVLPRGRVERIKKRIWE